MGASAFQYKLPVRMRALASRFYHRALRTLCSFSLFDAKHSLLNTFNLFLFCLILGSIQFSAPLSSLSSGDTRFNVILSDASTEALSP